MLPLDQSAHVSFGGWPVVQTQSRNPNYSDWTLPIAVAGTGRAKGGNSRSVKGIHVVAGDSEPGSRSFSVLRFARKFPF